MKIKDQEYSIKTVPLLSVVCITYNHIKYIREAIESFINQDVDFFVEILIHDDASTDGTDKIVLEYETKYPLIIKPIYQKINQYSISGFEFSFKELQRAQGKYIALCEGDDYWTDILKLQKQINFLENNSEFSMCFHKVTIKNETFDKQYIYPKPPFDILTFRDILFKHYIPTCSLVFVKEKLPMPFPNWLSESKMCDIPIELFLADNGKIKYIDSFMAVYRLNSNSLTNNLDHIKAGRKSYDFLYRNLRSHFGGKYYFLFTVLIIKNKLGTIKDILGLNRSLK